MSSSLGVDITKSNRLLERVSRASLAEETYVRHGGRERFRPLYS
jgi:hypothetical protein